MIRVNNLSFQYSADVPIFNDFNLEISDNFFGLVGINGAGKSTFLKLCLGFLFPQKGDILIDSLSVRTERNELLKKIGVLHENPQFPSWAKVDEYLSWVGQLRGLNRSESIGQTNFLLDKLDLFDKKNSFVSHLSAGLTQRFGVAQAVIGVPSIIFLDEPTTNLDVRSRYLILDFVKEIASEFDSQIIIMSHILSDLERYCDSVGILHEGEIKYKDSINSLINSTSHRFFIIRSNDLAAVKNTLAKLSIIIIKETPIELVVEINDPSQKELIEESLSKSSSIIPLRSLLEQKFLDLTGVSPPFHK